MRKILAAVVFALPLHAHAAPDLIDIYQHALAHDPIFKQAYSTYMSAREQAPQAAAQLLTTVAASGFYNHIRNISENPNPLFGFTAAYVQENFTLTLTQPVFNYQGWKAAQQANEAVRQAEATYYSAAQNLMIRTAQAYFTVLQAKDNLRFAKARKRANMRQLDQARQRFKVGLDAITSVYEAKAAYDSSNAAVITERNNLANQYENLRKLTNHIYPSLAPLNGSHVPLVRPEPTHVDDWVDTALKQNWQLIASRFAKKAAKLNISVQNAGHMPQVFFQANYALTYSDSNQAFLGSDSRVGSAGLNLQFPIFQSGLVNSRVKQAVYDFQTAQEQLEGVYRSTLVDTRIAFNTIIDGISKIRADRQAVRSAANSLESTEAQFKVGTRTMVDVVNAQQQLFQVQTQLATDQYSYILAILQLKFLAGTLSPHDLQEINAWLATNRRNRNANINEHKRYANARKP